MITTRSRKQSKSKILPYQDPKLSFEKRTKDLLSRMTLEEKVAQMVCIWRDRPKAMLDDHGNFDDLPPAAVAVWDRYLAYGAAMDLSDDVVRTDDAGQRRRQLLDGGCLRRGQ